jgi:DNA polymerase-1
LTRAFAEGRDVYQEAADSTGLARKVTKAMVLARFYGASVSRLIDATGLSFSAMRKAIDDLDRVYPEIEVFSKAVVSHVKKTGFLETFSGRRFQFDGEHSPFKDAANRLAQATVSQMIQRAMVRFDEELEWAPLWCQVHDEIINEVPEDRVEEFCERAREILVHQPWCSVPFVTESVVGTHWGEL